MRKLVLTTAVGLAAPLALTGSPSAQTSTNFDVQITIQAACVIASANNLNFGTTGVLNSDVDAASKVSVTCTNGTPYELSLNEGAGTGATVAARLMTSAAGDTVQYALYQDAARSTLWGNTAANVVSDTGNGAVQDHDVYGRVPAQTTPPPNTYTDTVTVTVSY